MEKRIITQVKSTIGQTKRHKAIMASLGLKKIGQSVEQTQNASLIGKLQRVNHLIKIEKA